MSQSPKKMLAVMLAILVGLSPLQSAMAGFADSFGQGEAVHQMADRHDGSLAMTTGHAMTQDCEQCKVDTGCCNRHGCSSGHCVSCALALLPMLSLPTHQTASSVLFRTDDGCVSQLSSALFRPPRA